MERARWKATLLLLAWLFPLLFIPVLPQLSLAQMPVEVNGSTYWGGGVAGLINDRANEMFTDLNSSLTGSKPNDDTLGWYVSSGMELPIWGLKSGHVILGEINMDFRKFGGEQAGFPGSGGGNKDTGFMLRDVDLIQIAVSFSPKYRFDNFVKTGPNAGRIWPWIIPAGLELGAISPPGPDVNPIDIGSVHAVGIDYMLNRFLIVGVDFRYHLASGINAIETSSFTSGVKIGLRF
jgi:hypothetical protein